MEEKIMNPTAGKPPRTSSGRRSVSVIPATKRSVMNKAQLKQQTNIRVAAYCRVSTGDESQQTSYTNQKAFYSGLIHSKPGWTFAGLYADEGLSGTTTAHRDQFNQMIEDAKNGKIDYIVTKSISRFARNTVTTLSCARELRQQNPPVGIYFEKENIDTLDATGELFLTIMSAMAQDESRSISDNIRWSFQKKFQAGIPQVNLTRMLGYDKGPNGEWVINEEQAALVRRIFKCYVMGESANKIATDLNDEGTLTPAGKKWSAGSIINILKNEKYVGDLEMQKTLTKDFLTHRSMKNKGEAPKYYVENHHTPIIDRLTWDKVQASMNRRKGRREALGLPPSADVGPEERRIKRGAANAIFSNLVCGEILPSTGKECGSGFFRLTYSNKAVGYEDDRRIAVTGVEDGMSPDDYTEEYAFSHPVWRCKGKFGERPLEEQPGSGGPDEKKYCRSKIGAMSDEEKANARCPSEVLNECAIKQSFMEMLYFIRRDYVENKENSDICRRYNDAYEKACRQSKMNSPSALRLDTVEGQIREMQEKLREIIGNQVRAMRETVLERDAELNEALAEGEISIDDIDVDIRNGLTGSEIGTRFYHVEVEEGSEADTYAKLADELRQRIRELEQERSQLEAEQGFLIAYKKNFDFFLKCLVELPDKNKAGMPLVVNGLDTDGSIFRDANGKAKAGKRSDHHSGHFVMTPERIREAPDYLDFERGIYAAFIIKGKVQGDLIEYQTNFGVKLVSAGNRRTLGSFLGFKRCGIGKDGKPDGTVEFLDQLCKVDGGKVRYNRKLKKSAEKKWEEVQKKRVATETPEE